MIVIVVIVIITVSVVVEVIVIILSERGSGCGGWCDREARLMMRRRKRPMGEYGVKWTVWMMDVGAEAKASNRNPQ